MGKHEGVVPVGSWIAMVAGALLMVSEAEAQPTYGWTISNSPTDPYISMGTAPTMGLRSLHLWSLCAWGASGVGVAAAEFDVAVPAGCSVVSFTPLNGFLNAGGAGNLLLATLCTDGGSVVAGTIQVLDTAPGSYCLVPSAANGKSVSVD